MELEMSKSISAIGILFGGCFKHLTCNCNTPGVGTHLWVLPALGSEMLGIRV